MRTVTLKLAGLKVPAIAVGCMRINRLSIGEARRFVQTALDNGANFFDHADVYAGGECEEIFAQAVDMGPVVREKLILQSKCGIVPSVRYDQSAQHILRSVEGSLRRLRTEYLDLLLLHRPDALVEPEEVADAFDQLHRAGKVRHFGVSNHDSHQIELLQKYVRQPLVVNQLQLSVAYAGMVAQGIHVNMPDADAVNRTAGVLNYCRLHDIAIQPWSPFQYGFFEGVFLGSEKYPELNEKIGELAKKYCTNPNAVALAWLLRHPATMQPVVGTMNTGRLLECLAASDITLSRDEWYTLHQAAGYTLP